MSGAHQHADYLTRAEYERYQGDVADPAPSPDPGEGGGEGSPLPADVFVRTYPSSGDDEQDDLEGQHAHEHGIQFVPAPGHPGRGAAQFLVLPGDRTISGPGGYRAEFHGGDHIESEDAFERWFGLAYYFAGDWDQGRNSTWDDRIIFQLHENNGSPVFSQHINSNGLWWRRKSRSGESGKFQTLARAQRPPGWADIVFRMVIARDDRGRFEGWLNGERLFEDRGPTLIEGRRPYTKWGVYGQPTKLLVGEVRRADGPERFKDVCTRWAS